MAVVDRAWHGYQGRLTPERWRFLVLPRFAWGDIFRSRLLTAYYVLCCLVPVVFALLIYVRYNLGFLETFGIQAQNIDQAIPIDSRFFATFFSIEAGMGFVFASFIGPTLIAPDVSHNALPLYFGRPLSRPQYVLGKFLSLAVLLSAITLVPAVLLFCLQALLAESGWAGSHMGVLGASVVAMTTWIVVVSLLALAVSALVRWRPFATAFMLAISAVGAALGGMVYAMLKTALGFVLSPGVLVQVAAARLFGVQPMAPVSPIATWVGLAGYVTLSLWVLSRRVRPTEVVK
jgi:ABC-type transport system involved in multi-copper enzyme maturation permease subunit